MGSVKTELDPSCNLITQTVTGDFLLQDFIKAFKIALNHPDFTKGMNVLWDLTDASLAKAEINDMHQMIKFIDYHIENRGRDFKLAIVANSKLEFGLSRMYEAFSEMLPFSKKVFCDIKEALNWINS